jgi:hypothetical protein
MLNAIMLHVIMLNVIMLNVIMLNVIMLNVVVPNKLNLVLYWGISDKDKKKLYNIDTRCFQRLWLSWHEGQGETAKLHFDQETEMQVS